MMMGNDRKRMDLGLDLERREAAMPRQLELAELEAVEGGNPVIVGATLALGAALVGVVVGTAVGIAAGAAIGTAMNK